MKIGSLLDYLSDLGRFLDQNSAATTKKQLLTLVEGLNQFREMEIKAFVEYLQRADSHLKGNPIPTRTRGSSSRVSSPKVSIDEVIAKVKNLYDNAKDLSVSEDLIKQELAILNEIKPRANLVKIAEAIELKIPPKLKMDEIPMAIQNRIFDRRGAAIQAGFVDLNPLHRE